MIIFLLGVVVGYVISWGQEQWRETGFTMRRMEEEARRKRELDQKVTLDQLKWDNRD